MKMKILFLLSIDLNKNGPSVHLINDIINSCKERGIDYDIIKKEYVSTGFWKTKIENESGHNITTITYKDPSKSTYFQRYMNEIKYAAKCKECYKNSHYSLVFLQSCNTALFHCKRIKKYLKCPIVYNVQDIFPLDMYYEKSISKKNPIYVFMDLVQKKAYKMVDRIITISEDMKNTLENMRIESKKIHIVYNWEYKNSFEEDEFLLVKNQFFPSKYFNVVYAGNIGKAQDVMSIVKIAEMLKNDTSIRFIIIGNGRSKNSCVRFADERGLQNIVFYDLFPQNRSKYIYKAASVNIVPLVDGILNTSLPSKTASCYNSQRPCIFYAKPEYRICKLLSVNKNFYFVDGSNLENIISKLYEIKNNGCRVYNSPSYCETVKNNSAYSYIDIFEEIMDEN